MSQMKKLQTMLTKGTNKTTQPATCLMILLLSMALVAVPNLKLGQNRQQAQEAELGDVIQENILQQQNRRNLLFDTKDQMDLVDEELNYEDIMMFGADKDNKEEVSEMCGLKPAKRSRELVDYDVDDLPWYRNLGGGGGEKSNTEFKLAAEEYQKNLKDIQSSGFNIRPETKVKQESMDDLSYLLSPKVDSAAVIASAMVKDVASIDLMMNTPVTTTAEIDKNSLNSSQIHNNNKFSV
jgi:cyclic AMP-responsive element-binding protein 3